MLVMLFHQLFSQPSYRLLSDDVVLLSYHRSALDVRPIAELVGSTFRRQIHCIHRYVLKFMMFYE